MIIFYSTKEVVRIIEKPLKEEVSDDENAHTEIRRLTYAVKKPL